eukprot:CAMPEP_0204830154 /NCGR_PEP_ID=MMETSP1346-20131115/8364_1 /ASSEMBLY_ACC=CAM_ASM_000771 /TAXON_ID=215587 /ORGANISM="Aplanochytrium stocchinoi, Strain GSBS06" /LENGTH=702 /DNA_ID=CAMNT_0051960299 /DNA_START=805 /DNA_END=2913 /DNA_ORIENTATION=-
MPLRKCVTLPNDLETFARARERFDFEKFKTEILHEHEQKRDASLNYCLWGDESPIFLAVQKGNIFPDSKYFVDMPLKHGITPRECIQRFETFTKGATSVDTASLSKEDLTHFLLQHFDPPDTEFDYWQPDDWIELGLGKENTVDVQTPTLNFSRHAQEPIQYAGDSDGELTVSTTCSAQDSSDSMDIELDNNNFEVECEQQHHPIEELCNGISKHEAFDARHVRFVKGLHNIWPQLGRKVSDGPLKHSTFLREEMQNGFIIPGGRFREVYYWDTYWIVTGILTSGMYQTAKGMVQNLLSLVDKYGFVPNGSRSYYLNRSQPPLLADMVCSLVEYDQEQGRNIDCSFLLSAFESLKKEYKFWMNHRVADSGSELYEPKSGLNVYTGVHNHSVRDTKPRPESYREDIELAEAFCQTEGERGYFYAHIRAACESGWDFSSRWFEGESLGRIKTGVIAPVCLNSIMLRFEYNMCWLSNILLSCADTPETLKINMAKDYESFKQAANKREIALREEMWCDELSCWRDVWMNSEDDKNVNDAYPEKEKRRSPSTTNYASDFMPLWAFSAKRDMQLGEKESLYSHEEMDRLIQHFESSGLLCEAGVKTSNTLNLGQQWDSTNVWAPIICITVEGLLSVGRNGLANAIATNFLNTCRIGFEREGDIYEKYCCNGNGNRGSGGEYENQVGFGWTNGTILRLFSLLTRQTRN